MIHNLVLDSGDNYNLLDSHRQRLKSVNLNEFLMFKSTRKLKINLRFIRQLRHYFLKTQ
jgi:hypothetical protein